MTPRVMLLKSWANRSSGKRYPVGTVLQVDSELGSELIRDGIAEKYSGPYPPEQKTKMELSKLKTK